MVASRNQVVRVMDRKSHPLEAVSRLRRSRFAMSIQRPLGIQGDSLLLLAMLHVPTATYWPQEVRPLAVGHSLNTTHYSVGPVITDPIASSSDKTSSMSSKTDRYCASCLVKSFRDAGAVWPRTPYDTESFVAICYP